MTFNDNLSTGLGMEHPDIPISLDFFLNRADVSKTTAWRWRKNTWLKTINISGRVYIMPNDLKEFSRRAASGEFAKPHKVPRKMKLEELN